MESDLTKRISERSKSTLLTASNEAEALPPNLLTLNKGSKQSVQTGTSRDSHASTCLGNDAHFLPRET